MRLCFVLLPDARPLTSAAFTRALKEFPELGKPGAFKVSPEGNASFTIGKQQILTALMPAPVPDGEADEATERSLSGIEGSWVLPEHRAHLVVVQQGVKKGVDLASLATFTRVVAAVARATGAVGVYWGSGGATHHPEFVVNIAQSELPLPLWVGVSVARLEAGVELLSVGMPQLELPDLVLRAPALDGGVLEFFYDLLAYVVRRGKQLPEGDSVGRTDKERIAVHYEPSPVDEQQQVWAVTLPGPKAKKAKAPKKAPVKAKKARKAKKKK